MFTNKVYILGVLQTDEDKYGILVGIENLLYSTLQVKLNIHYVIAEVFSIFLQMEPRISFLLGPTIICIYSFSQMYFLYEHFFIGMSLIIGI